MTAEISGRTAEVKIGLTGLFLFFLFFIPLGNHYSNTILMTDPYWRYQGQLLAVSIENSARLPNNPYPTHSYLLSWVNDFSDDFASPLIVAIVSKVTGLPTRMLFNSPLFTPALVLSTALLAKKLSSSYMVFTISILLGISFKYLIHHITFASHRGALGWALVITICSVLAVTYKMGGKRQLYLAFPLFIVLPMAVHTLPVASILLFSTLFLASWITRTPLIRLNVYLTGISLIILYNALVFKWLGLVFYKFAIALAAVQLNSVSDFVSSLTTSASLYPELQELQVAFQPPALYSEALTYSNIVALLLVSTVGFYRGYIVISGRRINQVTPLDLLLVSFGMQGIAGVTLLPLFAASGGYSPLTLGLIITPLFGSISLYLFYEKLREYSPSRFGYTRILAFIIILLLITAPAFGAFSYKPTTSSQATFSTSEENYAQISWSESHLTSEQRVFSDFNSLSRYYTVDATKKSYIPPTGSPVYSTKRTARKVVKYYYTNPSSVHTRADVYLVSYQMTEYAMFHLGAVTTSPNEDLNQQLGRSRKWYQVYTTGKSYTFVDGTEAT